MPKDKAKPRAKRKAQKSKPVLTMMRTNFVLEATRTDSDRPNSFREAFMRITDTSNMKSTTINNEASRMANRPDVRAEIERINREKERLRIRTRKSSATAIENALWVEASNPNGKSADKIRALQVLVSMLPPVTGESEDHSLLEKDEIIKRIESIFKESVGEPIDVSTAEAEVEVEVEVETEEPKAIASSSSRYSPSAQASIIIDGFISSDSDESQTDDDDSHEDAVPEY